MELNLTKHMKKLLLPLLSLLILLPSADARFWTNKEGNSFEGELVEVKDNAVTIRRTRDRIKFTVNVADLSQGDQEYLKELAEKKKLEEDKKAEEEASKNKTKSSKNKIPTTKEEFAKWMVGTEWAVTQTTIATGANTRRTLRFYPDGVGRFQFGGSEWEKNLKADENDYSVLSENSLLWGDWRWKIVFDKKFKTFTGKAANSKAICSGKLVERFLKL